MSDDRRELVAEILWQKYWNGSTNHWDTNSKTEELWGGMADAVLAALAPWLLPEVLENWWSMVEVPDWATNTAIS